MLLVIVIKLEYLMHFRIMVLDQGQIAEYENPQVLLADKSSIFYGMAKDAGLVE